MKDGPEGPKDWSVYLLRCGDGSLYTGVAKDVGERLKKHQAGRGAAYTRTRLPVALVYQENGYTRSEALVREARIKRWPKARKEGLTCSPPESGDNPARGSGSPADNSGTLS